MRVSIRFICVDLPNFTQSRQIDLTEGSTVEQAVTEYLKLYDMEDTLDRLPDSMFLVGKKTAAHDTVLQDNDDITVLRILSGG